jgi:hypothetical protein
MRGEVLQVQAMALLAVVVYLGTAVSADYVFESLTVKGVGYQSHEVFGETASGDSGQKLSQRTEGSGSSYGRTTFELDASLNSINYTQSAEFEYFPISYQTGTYDRKWRDQLCVKNYDIGAVLTESYDRAEHLQKDTEIRSIGNDTRFALQAQLSSEVIGVAHIGWRSVGTEPDSHGRYLQIGGSREDLTGVFSVDKYIELLLNSSQTEEETDWLRCT